MLHYDLIIIGGGPAGTSAAITAARGGAGVLLLERGRFPRHKVCGEFVSAESLGLLTNLLDHDHATLLRDAVRISKLRLFLDGRTLQTAVDPPAASIARLNLDAALWHSAGGAGVDARQQVTVQSVGGTGPFRIMTTAGGFEARALVNAYGENARVVGRVNASAMVRADVASTLAEVFAQHPALHERSRRWTSLSDPVSTSPLLFRNPQPNRDGILMVGDAAGFVDPFVGDGISLALRSGSLAAHCLAPFFAGEASLSDAPSRYRELYGRSLLPVFRASSKIRQMLRLPRTLRKPLLMLLENAPGITRFAVRKTR